MNPGLKHIVAIVLFALITAPPAYSALDAHEPTRQVFTLNAKSIRDDYVISVSLPEEYHTSSDTYPLLLMLDGEFAFNSAADISLYLQRDGAVRPCIVVGVSYGVGFGAPLAAKRSRDFTPPTTEEGVIAKAPSAYYAFLKEELIPIIAGRYRIQRDDTTLWSYSLSGTFATWLNYYDRQLFTNYIIASPNLGYGILGKIMAGDIFTSDKAVPKKVIMSMDPMEADDPENYFKPDAPEINEPLRELISKFKGYEFRFHVTQGESHATSWLVALPTSLRFIFGQRFTNNEGKKLIQPPGPTAASSPGSP